MTCEGACAGCGGLVDRVAALETKIAKLEEGSVERKPSAGLLGISDIERRAGADRSTVNRWIRSRKFPAPVAYSGNRRRWTVASIEKWEAERARTRHEPLIRGVVKQRRAEAQGTRRAV